MTAKSFLWSLCALWLAIGSAGIGRAAQEPASEAPEPTGEARLLEIEAVTESFLNRLLDLSALLVARDEKAGADYFAPRFEGRLPALELAAPETMSPLLKRRSWSLEPSPRELSRDQMASHLRDFLSGFSIEKMRFDIPRSTVEGGPEGDAAIEADLLLSIYAYDREGRREWIRGRLAATARRSAEGPWLITSWRAEEVSSLIARHDLFNDVTAAAGVAVAPDLPLMEAAEANQRWYPNGASARDVDQDGLLDLLVTGPNGNFLYLGQEDGTFNDVAARTGLKTLLIGKAELTPALFDYDNDGDADLFLTSEHENLLLENRLLPDGRLLFRDVSQGLPQRPEIQGWSVAVGDVNGDALPDLYVVSYFSPMKGPFPRTTVDDVNGAPNLLLINQGDGSFQDATEDWNAKDGRFSMAAQFADVDGDHDLDLYVANDFGGGNSLFINHGDRFVDEARERGVEFPAESMGVSFADYDHDGDLDLHVTNMSSVAASRFLARFDGRPLRHREHLERQWSGNSLFENQGDGTFVDVTAKAGPFLADWAWGGGFLDVDNDGHEDLHSPGGFLSGESPYDGRSIMFSRVILALQEEKREDVYKAVGGGFKGMGQSIGLGHSFGGHTSDRMYLNRGDGTFTDVSGIAGADTMPSDARSSVYADFDNDGDLDLFVRATHGRSHFLFRNEIGQEAGFLRVALEGTKSGRNAFGAVVRVKAPNAVYTKAKRGSNGYLAQNDPRLLFGLGEEVESTAVEWIEVLWPSGEKQRFNGPPPADSLLIVEGEAELRAVEEKRFQLAGGKTDKAAAEPARASTPAGANSGGQP